MGNKNAWKHGRYSEAAVAERRKARELIQRFKALAELVAKDD